MATQHPVPYTRRMALRGRYRWRTELRALLPGPLSRLVPKGRDCLQHEWYCADDSTDRCYHCTAAARPHGTGTADGTVSAPLVQRQARQA